MPEGERAPWEEGLLRRLSRTAVEVLPAPAPDAAPVSVRVEVETGAGETPGGPGFCAARARAFVRLHRANVEVASRPGVSPEEAEAVGEALADLAERVALVLGW